MKVFTVSSALEDMKLIRFLNRILPGAQNGFLYKMLRKKNIVLNDKKADGNEILKKDDIIKIYFSDSTFDKFALKTENQNETNFDIKDFILYEDEDIIIINKPDNLLSQKAKAKDVSLTELINQYIKPCDGFKAGVSNRLDRNTTGVVSAGKSIKGLHALNDAIRDGKVHKIYYTIVLGNMTDNIRKKAYLIKDKAHNKVSITDDYIKGAALIDTEFMPVSHYRYKGEAYTLLKVRLYTGKSHQIRAHLKHLGFIVLGDSKYGKKDNYKLLKKDFKLTHHLLHAGELLFDSDESVNEILRGKCFTAPLPKKFEEILHLMEEN